MTVTKYAPYYKMNHSKRGLAYIFNHQKFEECPERHGTKQDVNRLTHTLSNLNFEVNVFTDLRYQDITEHLKQGKYY